MGFVREQLQKRYLFKKTRGTPTRCAIFLEKTPDQKCIFAKAKNQGMTSVYDWRRTGVASVDDCHSICMQWAEGMCRSYTFDRLQNICYLSHVSSRTASLLVGTEISFNRDHAAGMEIGDLDDCVSCKSRNYSKFVWICIVFFLVQLNCQQEAMLISGESMRMFSGHLETRNKPSANEKVCASVVTDTYKFESKVMYDDCGTKKSVSIKNSWSNF